MSEQVKKSIWKKWWFWIIVIVVLVAIANFDDEEKQQTKTNGNQIDSEQTNSTNAEQYESDNATDVILSPKEQRKRLKEHLNFLKETYDSIKREFENQKSNYNEDIWINFVNKTQEKIKQKRNEFEDDFSPANQKAPDYFDEVVLLTEIYSTIEVSLLKEMWDYLDNNSGDPQTPMNQIESNLDKINL